MKRRGAEKEKLYRKVNTRTHGVQHGCGGKAKWDRNAKAQSDTPRRTMRSGLRHGRDYTPLFRFLLSRVGQPWRDVHSEAVSRLDEASPIEMIVTPSPLIRYGESSYFSGLRVDDAGLLQLVAPEIVNEALWPVCPCCTHTFNGRRFVNRFQTDRADAIAQLLSQHQSESQP